jgi:hypothetical protein
MDVGVWQGGRTWGQLTKNQHRVVRDTVTGETWIQVQLTNDKILDCDTIVLSFVHTHCWRAVEKQGLWYARTKAGYFHKLLTGYRMTDHLDRNGLNNRSMNLRETTPLKNMHNRRISRNNTTGRAGVTYSKSAHGYTANIGSIGTRSFTIRRYGEEEAFRLACAARSVWEIENGVISQIMTSNAGPVYQPYVQQNHQCPLCINTYSQRTSLLRHIKRNHNLVDE